MNKQVEISVILPVYNASKYLRKSIESVLNQSFVDFELIIINDASTDDSEEIIKQFTDSRIIYIKNEVNKRLIKTLNLGLSVAKGKYIARMDADDIAIPNRFEMQVSFLNTNQDYVLVGTSVNQIEENDVFIKRLNYFQKHEELVFSLVFFSPFVHPSVMIRKSTLDTHSLQFDENFLHAEDYELWTRLVRFGKVANINEPLLEYRVHQNQISSIYTSEQLKMNEIIQLNYLSEIFKSVDKSHLNVFFKLKQFDFITQIKSLIAIKKSNGFKNQLFSDYLNKQIKTLLLESKNLNIRDLFFLHLTYTNSLILLSFRQYLALWRKVF